MDALEDLLKDFGEKLEALEDLLKDWEKLKALEDLFKAASKFNLALIVTVPGDLHIDHSS